MASGYNYKLITSSNPVTTAQFRYVHKSVLQLEKELTLHRIMNHSQFRTDPNYDESDPTCTLRKTHKVGVWIGITEDQLSLVKSIAVRLNFKLSPLHHKS